LAHLLDPGRDRPARWLRPSFTAEVTAERRRLHDVVRTGDLAVPPGLDGSYASAVQSLARDAGVVATAVRQLEIERSGALPAWDELVRRGLPAMPTLIETVTWFG
jgi:hypothetical protein